MKAKVSRTPVIVGALLGIGIFLLCMSSANDIIHDIASDVTQGNLHTWLVAGLWVVGFGSIIGASVLVTTFALIIIALIFKGHDW